MKGAYLGDLREFYKTTSSLAIVWFWAVNKLYESKLSVTEMRVLRCVLKSGRIRLKNDYISGVIGVAQIKGKVIKNWLRY